MFTVKREGFMFHFYVGSEPKGKLSKSGASPALEEACTDAAQNLSPTPYKLRRVADLEDFGYVYFYTEVV